VFTVVRLGWCQVGVNSLHLTVLLTSAELQVLPLTPYGDRHATIKSANLQNR
jgi:hypothetical protein